MKNVAKVACLRSGGNVETFLRIISNSQLDIVVQPSAREDDL